MWRCRPRCGLPHMSIATREFLRDYWSGLKKLPELVKHISFSRRSLEQELQEAVLRGSLRKAFSGLDMLLLGLGIIIGTGIYSVTGTQLNVSGSGIVIAYTLSCLLGVAVAACFGELCMEYPVSGGAFTYIMLTFGELPAWLTVSFLIQQYIFGLAVEGRGFSTYVTQLFNQPENLFRYPKCIISATSEQCQVDIYALDFMAPAIILVLTLVISAGGRESSFFISTVTLVKIVVMVVIFATAFTQANPSYLRPDGNFFTPEWGVDGVFKAMATLFFTFIGFDAITNAAEEVDDISYLPWALVGSVLLAGVLYVVMSLSLVMMVPYTALIVPATGNCFKCTTPSSFLLSTDLAFTKAFKCLGLNWAPYVVATASLLGILTAMLVGLFAVARLVMSASRDWLLPPSLARISTRTQTPLTAQITIGIVTALVAMIGSEGLMANLSVFGALFGSWWVVNAQIFRRYYPDVKLRFTRYGTVETQQAKAQYRVPGSRLSRETRMVLVWVHLAAITAIGVATSIYYQTTGPTENEDKQPPPPPPLLAELAWGGSNSASLDEHGPVMAVFLGIWFLVTLSMQLLCPLEYEPPKWHIPWWMLPWVPSAAIAFIIFSISNLQPEKKTFIGIAICMAVTLLIYFLFSLPMSYIKHFKVDYAQTEKLRVVELVCQGGQWKPAKGQAVSFTFPPAQSAAHSHKTDILSLAGRPSTRPSMGTQPSMQPPNGASASSQASGSSGHGSDPSAHGRRGPPPAPSIPEEEEAHPAPSE